MKNQNILIIGGGIGGLTAAIALGKAGHRVTIVEKDPDWAVYGVGIIQQANVVRAMAELGIIDDYLEAGFGFDEVEVYIPTGERVARISSPRLVEGLPANVGIGRRRLHEVLGRRAKEAGADVRLGVTVDALDNDGEGVTVSFSDGGTGRFDLVIGADGLYSKTRGQIFPDSSAPEFTGQSVWRYNFPRTEDVTCLQAYDGQTGVGLVPLSADLMYMYVTTPEPGNPWYETAGNNTFSYFTTPNGFAVEYTADLEEVDDATWEAQVYTPAPLVMDQWGIGIGGPQTMPHPEPNPRLFEEA